MALRRELAFTFALLASAALARGALVGISDPSEGRYAQIAWEMERSGDWIVPRWNGIPHLEKPPLAYWAGALGLRLFGRSELALRAFPLLALLLAAGLAADLARRLYGDRAAAPAAVAVALLPYPLAVGGALLTDGFLLFSATLFFHAIVRRERGAGPFSLDLAAAAIGIGALAKGHAILLFTILPLLAARPRLALAFLHPRRLSILALLLIPWVRAVSRRHPDFLALHSGKLADFLGAGRQHHRAPPWTYVATLALGMAPMSFFWPTGLRTIRGSGRRLLLSWLLLPLLVLSAVKSRSFTYILPAVPAFAILCAGGLANGSLRRFRGPVSLTLLLGAAASAVAALLGLPGRAREFAPILPFLGGALAVGGTACLLLGASRPRLAAAVGALAAAAAFTGATLVDESVFKIHRGFARALLGAARPGDPVIVAGAEIPSLPFYLGRPVTVAGVGGRLAEEAALWGGSDRFLPYTDLAALLRSEGPALLVAEERTRRRLAPGRAPALTRDGLCLLDRAPAPRAREH